MNVNVSVNVNVDVSVNVDVGVNVSQGRKQEALHCRMIAMTTHTFAGICIILKIK